MVLQAGRSREERIEQRKLGGRRRAVVAVVLIGIVAKVLEGASDPRHRCYGRDTRHVSLSSWYECRGIGMGQKAMAVASGEKS